jgi:hypothetical protein
MAARVIRERDGVDETPSGGLLRSAKHLVLGFAPRSSTWHQFQRVDEMAGLLYGLLHGLLEPIFMTGNFLGTSRGLCD